MNIELDKTAYAIRPVRVDRKNDTFIYYEGTTFPKGAYEGCELALRRCHSFGYLKDDGSDLIVDVLDQDGDIVQDFPITRKGFEYLRRQLKFKRAAS